jgi:dethiobiotin synthetase
MSAIFITATGTDIGKTYLTTALIRHFRRIGQPIDALKPVVTGFDAARPETSDTGQLLAALGRSIAPDEFARISPWRFAAPLAPDLAAQREGRMLDFDALVAFSRNAARDHAGTLLIEGIGGIMVPLNDRHTVLDWMCALDVPLVLVAGSYLGSISHTLTCLDVLLRRALAVRVVVVNETPGSTVTVAETIETVARFAQPIPVVGLPWSAAHSKGEDIEHICSYL